MMNGYKFIELFSELYGNNNKETIFPFKLKVSIHHFSQTNIIESKYVEIKVNIVLYF